MNFGEMLRTMNYLAVAAAAFSTFILGGLWYGPLFGAIWMKENKFDEKSLAASNPLLVFGASFALAIVSAFNLALFLGPKADLVFGVFAGAMTGLFFVSTFLGIIYLFERRTLRLFLINAGYVSLAFTLMGAIIGAWR